eukprot:4726988-Amphidinium_carterae.1
MRAGNSWAFKHLRGRYCDISLSTQAITKLKAKSSTCVRNMAEMQAHVSSRLEWACQRQHVCNKDMWGTRGGSLRCQWGGVPARPRRLSYVALVEGLR